MGKYLDNFKKDNPDANIYPFNTPLKEEKKKRRKTCKEYGFDVRETFDMDGTIVAWLYERLKYFLDVCCINLEYYHFDYKGENLTQKQCMERMIKDCEILMCKDLYPKLEDFKKFNDAKDELFEILSLIYYVLWW